MCLAIKANAKKKEIMATESRNKQAIFAGTPGCRKQKGPALHIK